MGADQYVEHKGMRGGRPTSGTLLWGQAEAERNRAAGNMVNAETNLLHKVADDIGKEVPHGITIVELGPGTATAFRNKTLPIVDRLESTTCILVDENIAFLEQIAAADGLRPDLHIKPVIDDFFVNETAYSEEPALVCSFGSTISNIVNPVSDLPPKAALVDSLAKLAHATSDGWLLIGFDSDQDGERIKSYFKKHALFQLNVFDRMAAELPITGNFDPEAFDYEPEWIVTSGQLAHMAIVSKDMKFRIGATEVELKKGQKLHIKNSYKFTPKFFEDCCKLAGLEMVKTWSDDSPAKIYLLKIQPRPLVQRQNLSAKPDTEDRLQVA